MTAFSVDEFIESQPAEAQKLLNRLRYLVREALPHVEESIKWQVPFYSYRGLLCYFNPIKGGVHLGFPRGTELSNEDEWLTGTGKQVRWLLCRYAEPLPEEAIRQLVYEAADLNQQQRRAVNRNRLAG